MSRTFKTLAGIAAVASVVLSVKGASEVFADIDLDIQNFDVSELSSDLSQTVIDNELEQVEIAVNELISRTLEKNNITDCEVCTFTDISDNGDISISRVSIICPVGYKEAVISVTGSLGIKADVTEREVNSN